MGRQGDRLLLVFHQIQAYYKVTALATAHTLNKVVEQNTAEDGITK
jgi:hypothetical protein